jgi:hypothetical protein
MAGLILGLAGARLARGQDQPSTEQNPQSADDAGLEARKRQEALVEYERKMKAANYPVLFDQAAKEFNVPADILKAVAFAETRWDHLTWPPGETASPESGMPRPYGIMSLWDNRYFGHSLIEAAQLIGENPEVLKQDPLQNMRGGAALLRKLYDETPKPADTPNAAIESWRYAIRKYCGIPEPDLAASHVLDVYIFMSQGYHQYGIQWNSHAVNLAPIREEAKRLTAEERAKRQARVITVSNNADAPAQSLTNGAASPLSGETNTVPNTIIESATNPPPVISEPEGPSRQQIVWFIVGALAALGGLSWFSRQQGKRS